MRLFLVVSTLLLVTHVSWWIFSEVREVKTAHALVKKGMPAQALSHFEQLSRAGLTFVDSREVDFGRERAALETLLQEALPEKDFFLAAHLINIVLEEPETGLEGQVNAVAQRLPALHIEWTDGLIDEGRFEAARESLESMTGLYTKYPKTLERIARLRHRCEIENIRRLIEAGDPILALKRLNGLPEPELDLPLRHEVEFLLVDAIRHRADGLYEALDAPSLYRFLGQTISQPGLHPRLQQRIRRLQEGYDQKFFGFSVRRYARGITPLIPSTFSNFQDTAILRIENKTDRAITVQLIGPEQIKLSVASGRTEEVLVSVGEYVEVSHSGGGQDIAPYFEIHHLKPMRYQQAFTIDRTRPYPPSIVGRSS